MIEPGRAQPLTVNAPFANAALSSTRKLSRPYAGRDRARSAAVLPHGEVAERDAAGAGERVPPRTVAGYDEGTRHRERPARGHDHLSQRGVAARIAEQSAAVHLPAVRARGE